MKLTSIPLSALLGMTGIVKSPPEAFGPSLSKHPLFAPSTEGIPGAPGIAKMTPPTFAPDGIERGATGLSSIKQPTFSPPDASHGVGMGGISADSMVADDAMTALGIATDPPADLDLVEDNVGTFA